MTVEITKKKSKKGLKIYYGLEWGKGPGERIRTGKFNSRWANKVLKDWVNRAGINKHITWHCLRHSVSDIMQTAGIDVMTVAAFLGQSTAKYIFERYKKSVREKDTSKAVKTLPSYTNEDTDNLRLMVKEYLGSSISKN